MSSVVTDRGHTKRALSWFRESDPVFGIGRTTPWDNELLPPAPDMEDRLEETVFYKKCEQKSYVVPDPEGEVFYRGSFYRMVSEEEAIALNCRWVFCCSWINYDEAPVCMYRQIGVYTEFQPVPGQPSGKMVFLPTEVLNPGDLEILQNDTPTARSADKRERVAVLIEF